MNNNELMYGAVLENYRNVQWKQVPIPDINENQVLIKVGHAGICGSDQHIFNGDFQPRTKTPFIQGHEFAGTIVATGNKVKDYKEGDRVAVDPIIWCGTCAACQIGHYPACTSLKLIGVDMNGGFGEYVAADEDMLYRIGPEISDKHAALVEMYSIGFHACKRAGVQKGDSIAIWGAGRIGQSILQAARTRTENTIYIVDVLDNRLKIARDSVANVVTINSNETVPVAVIKEQTQGRGVDVAFEAVGHAQPIEKRPHPVRCCIQSIRGAGTVCTLGLADEPAPIDMKELIWGEAKIVASRVSHGEFRESIEHMSLGHLNPDVLISCVLPASKTQEAFSMLENNPQDYLKIVLKLS